MSKERLGAIKDKVTGIYNLESGEIDGVDLTVQDYEWLIEQAERFNAYVNDTALIHEQNKRYQEALKKIMLEQHQYMEGYETETFSIAKNVLGMSENDVINLLEGTE